jgi:hypothetical protein
VLCTELYANRYVESYNRYPRFIDKESDNTGHGSKNDRQDLRKLARYRQEQGAQRQDLSSSRVVDWIPVLNYMQVLFGKNWEGIGRNKRRVFEF